MNPIIIIIVATQNKYLLGIYGNINIKNADNFFIIYLIKNINCLVL